MGKSGKTPRLVSGIQPTGRLHIGNYLGALKNFIQLQDSDTYETYFFIADLHSLTEEYSPNAKREQVLNLAADFLAAGLDPKKSTLFLQSLIPAHSELMWFLNTITPMGELERMTQFKDKGEGRESANVGLFDYPVLMAADIILYSASVVPVGNDQDQHLELTRTLARKFNKKFGPVFVEPKPLHTDTPRVMSLDDPTKKMSKSRPAGCLFIDDEPAEIEKKIKRAVTDSGTAVKGGKDKPALNNLLGIYCAVTDKTIHQAETDFEGQGYAQFKSALAKAVADYFSPLRAKKKTLLKKPNDLVKILEVGSKKAEVEANKKLAEVRSAMGLSL